MEWRKWFRCPSRPHYRARVFGRLKLSRELGLVCQNRRLCRRYFTQYTAATVASIERCLQTNTVYVLTKRKRVQRRFRVGHVLTGSCFTEKKLYVTNGIKKRR